MKQSAVRSSDLDYPFAAPPKGSERIDVAPGVQWLRMPLPFSLDHINVWLIEEDQGHAIVDTGLNLPDVHQAWDNVFSDLPELDIRRVVVTHLHPDHVGSAGWLCDRWHCALWMTRTEYLLTRMLKLDGGPPPETAIGFYRAAGFDENMLSRYRRVFGQFGAAVSALPASFHRMCDGDQLRFGSHTWEVIVGRGHAPEHACLYCESTNTIIAGDQILPRITSNVSVWPYEPEDDPLSDWIESCNMLIERLPEDVLVLPAHNEPFRGAHIRLRQIIAEHELRLERLEQLCRQPQRVVDTFETLFDRPIDKTNRVMATGESIAHLHYLRSQGLVIREFDDAGVAWYTRRA